MSPPWLVFHPGSQSALTDTPCHGCHWHAAAVVASLSLPCCSTCSCGCSQRADRDSLQCWLWMSPAGCCLCNRFTSASLPSWAAEGTGPGDGGGGVENRTNVVQVLCIIILLSTAPTLLLPTAFGSGHPMETGLCSRLLHLSGIWPEAWVPARARQGGGSPESGDR